MALTPFREIPTKLLWKAVFMERRFDPGLGTREREKASEGQEIGVLGGVN
jgi:hypothetical protein